MKEQITKQVYGTAEILTLYGIKKDALSSYIQQGIIPKPINNKPNQKKVWLKSTVDKALGITRTAPINQNDIKAIVLEILNELTGKKTQKESISLPHFVIRRH